MVLCCLRAYVVRIPLTPVFREPVYDLQHISKWAHGHIIVEPPDPPKEVQPCSKNCWSSAESVGRNGLPSAIQQGAGRVRGASSGDSGELIWARYGLWTLPRLWKTPEALARVAFKVV